MERPVIDYTCPECNRPMQSSDENAGKIVSCPSCRTTFPIPAGGLFSGLDVDSEPEPEPEPRPSYRDRSRKPSKKESSGTGLLLVGIGVGVLLIGAGVLGWYLVNRSTQGPATESDQKGASNSNNPPPDSKQQGPLTPEEIYKRMVTSAACIMASTDIPNKYSLGSGCLIDQQRRLVLTAYHVVQNAAEITVLFPKYDDGKLVTDREQYSIRNSAKAKVWRSDPSKDLAILLVDWLPNESKAIPLAAASPGPTEETHTVGGIPAGTSGMWIPTKGNVREVQKDTMVLDNKQRIDSWIIRTTNPVNSGDSGGALANQKGELVGVVCAINRQANGVMCFIDVREVKALWGKK